MNIILLWSILFCTGAGVGGYVTAFVFDGILQEKELEKASQELVWQKELEKTSHLLAESYLKNSKLNIELEKSYETNLDEINSLHTQLLALNRMSKQPNVPTNPLPKTTSSCTKLSTKTSRNTELSNGLKEILISRALNADKLSLYAKECHEFVVKHNCGVER